MVSTRGQRYKFSDGEKVLCYEPDPTKAKVLYDSKVIKVLILDFFVFGMDFNRLVLDLPWDGIGSGSVGR